MSRLMRLPKGKLPKGNICDVFYDGRNMHYISFKLQNYIFLHEYANILKNISISEAH